MEVWLYDENPFPSGIGGLKVSSRPEYRNRYMECREVALGPGVSRFDLPQGEVAAVCDTGSGRPLKWERNNGELFILNADSTASAAIYLKRIIDNPNGKIFGINYMDEGAVGVFIELTHEKYAEHLGEYFGSVIKGIFLDEPTLLPWHQDINWYTAREDGRVLAWDDKIPAIMFSERGSEPGEILHALFYGTNDTDGKIRRHFWKTVSDLYEKTFFKACSLWCRRHRLQLTGHVLLEEGLYFNHLFQGNIQKNLEHLDIPGTDQLCAYAEMPDMGYMVGGAKHMPKMKTNIQGQKTVSSVSHLSGKKRTLSESFGLGGWAMNPGDMKRIVDWQYALGINQLCVHAFFYSIEGFRKYDAPPCHMHNSHWANYRVFADYVARLSYVLSSGRHIADTAVLYPLSAFRSAYIAGEQRAEDKGISDIYDMLCSELMKLHYDYDIIGEHHLEGCEITDGRICIAGEVYSVLLIPSLRGLPEAAVNKIAAFTAEGGQVLVFNGDKPGREGGVVTVGRLDLDTEEDTARFAAALEGFLGAAGIADVTISGELNRAVYCLHRSTENEEIYFFANTSDKRAHVEITVAAAGSAYVYDAETGSVSSLDCSASADGTRFAYVFEGHASLIAGFSKSKRAEPEPQTPVPSGLHSITMDRQWRFAPEGYNVYPLDDWTFNIGISSGGAAFTYTNTFFVADNPSVLKIMLDDIEYRGAFMGLADITVRVNGQTVPFTGESYIDAKFKLADIAGAVRAGENTIEIRIGHSAWSDQPHLLTSPVKLLGSFAVYEREGKTVIGSPAPAAANDSWTLHGYPYYSGAAVYSGEVGFETCPSYTAVEFTCADCAEVFVNGHRAGIRLWPPMRFDISGYVREGVNKIDIRVTNSMVNFMESQPKTSGLTGDVTVYFI
ncbi:MAG: glycosyl hydrolase [Eubacteriales bacterium]|nr:glycosyl hydrolase [Eubacteriales bacterium]